MLLQACLNGSRTNEEHPAIPRTSAELASEGRRALAAGAQVLHLHPYDDGGTETFAAGPCAATLRAVRAACPGVPISLSTSQAIEPHPQGLEAIARWTELPELVTANQGEEGIVELCQLLIARGGRGMPAHAIAEPLIMARAFDRQVIDEFHLLARSTDSEINTALDKEKQR